MKFFWNYLGRHRAHLALAAAMLALFAAAFALYRLPLGAVAYPAALCLALGAAFAFARCRRAWRKARELRALEALPENLEACLEKYASDDDLAYRAIIADLERARRDQAAQADARMRDMLDYYTTWAHQIKTPIAAMRLTLQNEDTALSRKLSEELSRVERYVEMVMTYLRLDSDSTDYLFRSCELDDIVRPAVRKFAGQFISKGLKLNYAPLRLCAVTDEKWLGFVIEQLLSNAVKYTRVGGVTIEMEPPATLCIRDSGIGIAPEDLPRVFEKGYTGYNGRGDRKASGLGLYLCRRVCANLGHALSAQSTLGEGTTLRIDLAQNRSRPE